MGGHWLEVLGLMTIVIVGAVFTGSYVYLLITVASVEQRLGRLEKGKQS